MLETLGLFGKHESHPRNAANRKARPFTHMRIPHAIAFPILSASQPAFVQGPKLAVPNDAITSLGRGEQDADENKAARETAVGHRLRDTPDVRLRKVEIELNGQCVLVLWGA
jgi:hypothetical protein